MHMEFNNFTLSLWNRLYKSCFLFYTSQRNVKKWPYSWEMSGTCFQYRLLNQPSNCFIMRDIIWETILISCCYNYAVVHTSRLPFRLDELKLWNPHKNKHANLPIIQSRSCILLLVRVARNIMWSICSKRLRLGPEFYLIRQKDAAHSWCL